MEVLGLLPPLAYFVLVWAKGSLSLVDAAVLTATYVAYLFVLLRMPPREDSEEEDEEIPARVALGPVVFGLEALGRGAAGSSSSAASSSSSSPSRS